MASPDILDLTALLTPIPGDNPAGPDLREDASPTSLYYRIKDARSAARAAERLQDSADETTDPQQRTEAITLWRTVLDLAPKTIAEKSKDLEITAWLIEALLRAHGFGGLRDGFKLAGGLVEAFGDALYPLPDDDGVATQVGPLSGLNGEGAEGTLIQPIRKVPITQSGGTGPFAAYHREQALKLAEVSDEKKKKRMIDRGTPTIEDFEAAIKETSPRYFLMLIQDLEQSIAAFAKLTAVLDAKYGGDAPPTSNIRSALEQQLELIKFLTKDIALPVAAAAPAAGNGAGEAAADDSAEGGGAAGTGAAAAARPAGEIVTRDDAFRQLMKIAEFFREKEPHSPISYTIEDVVRRGRLTLPDLLAELIPEPEARKAFMLRAGIQPNGQSAEAKK